MAKKSGSKSSRSERRAGRKRAERALEHGLPTRKLPPPRARAATPEPGSNREGTDRSSDAPPAPVAKSAGIPTLVKVLGAALVILVGVYLLSRQRDEALTETKPAPEPPVVATAAPVVETAAAEPSPPPPAPEVKAAPAPPAAVVSVTPPTKPVVDEPVVAAPVVSAPSRPKVEKALVAPSPKPAATPAAVAAPAVPAPVVAPIAPATPKPPAPKAPPAPPVDNPY